jgi:hypothetical protein
MRRFTDRAGSEWDVVLGRESWGVLLALFVPRGEGPVRQAALASSGSDTAAQELNDLDDAALQALLDRSTMKEG